MAYIIIMDMPMKKAAELANARLAAGSCKVNMIMYLKTEPASV